jgi:hypothetical protein
MQDYLKKEEKSVCVEFDEDEFDVHKKFEDQKIKNISYSYEGYTYDLHKDESDNKIYNHKTKKPTLFEITNENETLIREMFQ